MNLKQYVLIFGIGTAMAWSAWFLVLLSIDPVDAGLVAFICFYVTLVFGLSGLFTTLMTVIRTWRFPKRSIEDIIVTSLRQAFLLSILVVGSLILFSQGILAWLTVLILVAFVALVEFFFISFSRQNQS